jgi:protein O-mannosyl-transferase
MAACLPLVVAAIDLLVLRRSLRRVALATVPWIVLAIPIVIIARAVQPAANQIAASPLWARPLIAGDALTFYFWKLVAPLGLAMDYGRRPEVVLARSWIYMSWLVPLTVAVVVWMFRRRAPWLAAGAAVFVAALVPVLGLMPFGFQAFSTVADRYIYVAMLGPAVALSGVLAATRRFAACGSAGFMILILAILAHRQVRVWRDDLHLYPQTIRVNPDSFTANNNLAAALLEHARPADAIPYAQRACQLSPGFALAWINQADALAAVGRPREAIAAYLHALEIQPTHAAARAKLALALADVGDVDQAREEFDRAVRDDPSQRRIEPQLLEKIRARG